MTSAKPHTRPWRHHFLPKFYLRAWADDAGLLWRCRCKPNGKLEHARLSPKRVGYQADLYTMKPMIPSARPAYELETEFLASLDNEAGAHFQELRTLAREAWDRPGPKSLDIPAAKRRLLSRFMVSLLERHPDRITELEPLGRALGTLDLENLMREATNPKEWRKRNRFRGDFDLDAAAGNIARGMLRDLIDDPERLEQLEAMTWTVLSVREAAWATSDRSVITSLNVAPSSQFAIFAIDPTLLIMMHHGEYSDGPVKYFHAMLLSNHPTCIFSNRALVGPELELTEDFLGRSAELRRVMKELLEAGKL